MALTLQELQGMIPVNMGDYKLARGTQKLITRDLGSCVGIAMCDPQTGVGGLLHIMLPKYMPDELNEAVNFAKYADTGIEDMVKKLVLQGADKNRLVAKLAGAAHMMKIENVPESRDISSRNLEAVQRKLAQMNIPIVAAEVGDYYPRTVIFEPGSGVLKILTAGKEDRIL